ELHALLARRLGQLLLVRPRIGCPLPDPDWSGEVLYPLAAHVAEGFMKTIPDRLKDDVGYAYAAGLREPLQTRGDVHAVAEHVAFIEHDVAEIDPDAIDDPAVGRACAFALRHRGLDVDRAAHGVLDGSELRQHAVAGGLHDVPAAAGDLRVDQLPPVRLLALEHGLLILLHEPAVARHIGYEDGRESPLHWPSPVSNKLAEQRRRILRQRGCWDDRNWLKADPLQDLRSLPVSGVSVEFDD